MALDNRTSQPQAPTPFDSEKTTENGSRQGSLPPSNNEVTNEEKEHIQESNGTNGSNEGKRELTEDDCEDQLGFAFPEWRKWYILSVVFLVQVSMNFNTSLYSNGIQGISDKFDVSLQAARVGAAIFLITYAFGCELWAPWSEEFGRKPILQASLFLVNIFTLPVVLAPNFGCLLVGRALGGLSSAGGSVTLGMIADMFDSDHQQYAVAYIVFSSVGGSILGPIVGGFVQQYLAWQWTIWIQLIFGVAVQLLHLFTVPETRTTIMLDRIAKKMRKDGVDNNVYGPSELDPFWARFTFKELMYTWLRPFRMFLTEPIVLVLSLLSGFSDALIFMMIQSFSIVYGPTGWKFSDSQVGLAFIPIGVGYVIAWATFIPAIKRNEAARKRNPDDEHAQYESRLSWLLWLAPCLPIGLIIFAWTSTGPPLHWIGTMVGSCIIGIANYAIYMATIDYMICAYGPYSASATGGNGWSRDFLAGALTLPATPFFDNIARAQGKNLPYASTILFCISFLLVIAVYVIYWKGPVLRKRSAFAQSLAISSAGKHHKELPGHGHSHPVSVHPDIEHDAIAATPGRAAERPGLGAGSRMSSYSASHKAASRNASRANSRANSRATSLEENRPAEQYPAAAEQYSLATTLGVEGKRPGLGAGSRKSSYNASKQAASRNASRGNSRANSRANSPQRAEVVPRVPTSGRAAANGAGLTTIASVQPSNYTG